MNLPTFPSTLASSSPPRPPSSRCSPSSLHAQAAAHPCNRRLTTGAEEVAIVATDPLEIKADLPYGSNNKLYSSGSHNQDLLVTHIKQARNATGKVRPCAETLIYTHTHEETTNQMYY